MDYIENLGKKNTITTLEIAEMMGIEHWQVLRKLEGQEKGGKHSKGFIEILSDNNIVVADYFEKSSYIDAQGKERPCYKVTKLGCDFLANKFTGEKGILFTAKYVKRFREMEDNIQKYTLPPSAFESAANLGRLMERIMKLEGAAPHEIAVVLKTILEQAGIHVPDCFIKIPAYEQLSFPQVITK